jgi:selenocysteine lyase/cysteine desulfurase
VLDVLCRFEIEARANVHEGLRRRACAATDACNGARASAARFVNAQSPEEIVFNYGATSVINLLAFSFGNQLLRGDEILLSILEHDTWCPGNGSPSGRESFCDSCP